MPRNPLVPLVVAALLSLTGTVTAASAAPPAPSSGTKAYAATAPSPVTLSADPVVVVVLANCGPCEGGTVSTQSFASAEVRLPSDLVLGTRAPSVDRDQWSTSLRTDAGTGARFLRLVSTGKGTTTAVAPGSSVRLSIPVSAASAPGRLDFGTQVKQSNDFSGTGNDFTRVGAEPTVVLEAAPVTAAPDRLEFVQGPTTVQVSGTPEAATPGAVLVMCPAPQVRVLDADGAVITSLPPTDITLNPGTPSAALRLDGSTELTVQTSGGVATFGAAPGQDGRCATGLTAWVVGKGYSLTASGRFGDRTLETAAATFDVLPVYQLCGVSCSSPTLTGTVTLAGGATAEGTTAKVDATDPPDPADPTDAPDPLTFAVGLDRWDWSECNPDAGGLAGDARNPFRQVVTVDLADHDKLVSMSWTKQAVQWATNNGTSQWRVCMAAAYPFPTPTGTAVPVGNGWWVGQLLHCSAVQPSDACIATLGRSGGRQTATVRLPDTPGDPRMI